MATTPENNLRLDLPDIGSDDNTWGTLLNALIGYVELAITGVESIVVTGGTYTLDVTGTSADEARKAVLNFTGTLTSNQTIEAPNEPKVYLIRNATGQTASETLGIKTASGSILDIPNGETLLVWCDGSNNFRTINAQTSGTVALATNALQLGGVVAASYAQLAVKQSWTKPQTLTPENVTLSTNAYTPDVDDDRHIRVQQSEMTANVTINNPTGSAVDGQILIVEIEQSATTPRSVTWGSNYVFEDGTDLDLTQTVNRIDKFAFQYSSSVSRWLLTGAAQNLPRS